MTAEELKARWNTAGKPNIRIYCRSCSLCGVGLHYVLEPNFSLPGYQKGCGCNSSYGDNVSDHTWDDLKEFLDRNSDAMDKFMKETSSNG